MKDEIDLKAEYKEIFAKMYAPEELRRKVGRLSTGDIQKKSTSFIKKLAIAAAVVISLLVGSNGIVYAATGKTWMGYLIKPGTEEWKELGTVQNKREACRIPEETLKQMSNDELLEAVIEYPFLVEVYLYGAPGEPKITAAKSIYEGCDALRELLSRPDGEEVLRAFWEKSAKNPKKSGMAEWEIDAIGALLEVLCE